MGILDSLRDLLGRESKEFRDVMDSAEERTNATLDRKERELTLTPEERLAQIQGEIDDHDPMAEMREKIGHRGARAEAVDELSAQERSDERADRVGEPSHADEPEIIDAEVVSDSADAEPGDSPHA